MLFSGAAGESEEPVEESKPSSSATAPLPEEVEIKQEVEDPDSAADGEEEEEEDNDGGGEEEEEVEGGNASNWSEEDRLEEGQNQSLTLMLRVAELANSK